jgi:hypothetical protein
MALKSVGEADKQNGRMTEANGEENVELAVVRGI